MQFLKQLVIILVICAMLHIPFPKSGFADTAKAKTDTSGVTVNKPQFHSSAEEYLPGAGPKSGKTSGKSLMWIAAAVVAVAALAIGASGGGGGDSGGSDSGNNEPQDNTDTGGVGIEW
jgi:hypothetical protein